VWDVLITAQLREREDTEKWATAIRDSLRANQEAHQADIRKDIMMTKKMQKIVDMETELALKEGQTIVRGRKRHPLRVIKPES